MSNGIFRSGASLLPPALPPPPPPPPLDPQLLRPWPAAAPRRAPPVTSTEPGRPAEVSNTEGDGSPSAVGTVADQRDSGGQQSQDEEGGGEAAEEPLDPRISHIGDAVAMVCRYEQAQVVWSARIPLDPELLPQTVLFVAYSPGCLDLRFETPSWAVRELLGQQLTRLQSMVDERLSGACCVTITL